MRQEQNTFTLEKNIWTQDDYGEMGWHDCTIYGLAFLPVNENGTANLILDIDYIFKWVKPVLPEKSFSFWVSPCTLVFKNAFTLEINIDRRGGTTDMLEVADLLLVNKTEQEKNLWIYEWTIELQEGYIKFMSIGFDQIVRLPPVLTGTQVLNIEERNGISFNMSPCSM